MGEAIELRLNKYLSECGVCSRREADRLIEAGKVTVNGSKAVMGMKVTKDDEIICNGKPVGEKAGNKIKHVLLAVNKPRGVVCTTGENDRAPNIVDMISYPMRVYPIGRLDKDSEGLILMTNNGDLVNKIMRAGNAHEKEYIVEIDKPYNQVFLDKMSEGVELVDKITGKKQTTLACRLEIVDKRIFRIILTQGLNRQIRRMCETLGYHVTGLKRVRIMNIKLGNLKPGDVRKITPAENEELMKLISNSTNVSYKEQIDG